MSAQPFDARCVCPTHGWPPDVMADVERLREVAHAARAVLEATFEVPLGEIDQDDLTGDERQLYDLLIEYRRLVR